MRCQLKGLAIILVMALAFVIPEAHGFAIKGASGGPDGLESFAFKADIDSGGYFSVHAVPKSAYTFKGYSGDVKFSKKYSTGSVWSETGFDIQNAQAYDVAVWGDKSDSAKRTNAYLDLLATAEYIKAYGKSSTGTYQTGASMTVNEGSADIAIEAHADGKKMTSTTTLGTDYQGPLGAITGSTIDVSSYYKGGRSTGKLNAHVEDNAAIVGYSLLATSGKNDNGAKQSADSALGAVVQFNAQTNKNIPGTAGTNKVMSTNTIIRDGYINGYLNHIIDTPQREGFLTV